MIPDSTLASTSAANKYIVSGWRPSFVDNVPGFNVHISKLAFRSADNKWIVSGWRPAIVDNVTGSNILISKSAFRSAANKWIVSGWRHSIVPPKLHRFIIIIADVAVSPVWWSSSRFFQHRCCPPRSLSHMLPSITLPAVQLLLLVVLLLALFPPHLFFRTPPSSTPSSVCASSFSSFCIHFCIIVAHLMIFWQFHAILMQFPLRFVRLPRIWFRMRAYVVVLYKMSSCMLAFYCKQNVYKSTTYTTSCYPHAVTVVLRVCHMVFKLSCTVLYVGGTSHFLLCTCFEFLRL